MSVSISHLTKKFGEQFAIHDVSFQARKGEVLGLLGPNGAGKTTTMKILTCYIPQTSGNAEVCGYNTKEETLEVRKRIGYLPENNPLYRDMYVKEYLQFVSRVHKVNNAGKRINEMVEMTGLGLEQHKQIGALSKGYRQRVGLAQAMLHDPDVLILDEPTSGLDPNQLVEIRSLIKKMGREKTVIFSTHIMQEVQAVCDRVVIINRGKIVADDPIERLQERMRGDNIVVVEFKEVVGQEQLKKIKGVLTIRSTGKNRWALSASMEKDIRPEIYRFSVSNNLTLLEMYKETSSVEDVFQFLTRGKD